MQLPERIEAPSTFITATEAFEELGLIVDGSSAYIDTHDQDKIQRYIYTTVAFMDGYYGYLGRCIMSQKWRSWCIMSQKRRRYGYGLVFELPMPDASAVTITDLDTNAEITDFELKNTIPLPTITLTTPADVQIEATYGYGGAGDVPAPIKDEILRQVMIRYEFPETPIDTNMQMVSPYRVRRI